MAHIAVKNGENGGRLPSSFRAADDESCREHPVVQACGRQDVLVAAKFWRTAFFRRLLYWWWALALLVVSALNVSGM